MDALFPLSPESATFLFNDDSGRLYAFDCTSENDLFSIALALAKAKNCFEFDFSKGSWVKLTREDFFTKTDVTEYEDVDKLSVEKVKSLVSLSADEVKSLVSKLKSSRILYRKRG